MKAILLLGLLPCCAQSLSLRQNPQPLQHKSEETVQDAEVLATVKKIPTMTLNSGELLDFLGAVPVFNSNGDHYMALTHRLEFNRTRFHQGKYQSEDRWVQSLIGDGAQVTCGGDAQGYEKPEVFGVEMEGFGGHWNFNVKCKLPEADKDQPCHTITFKDQDQEVGKATACHNPAVVPRSKDGEKFKLVMCVSPQHQKLEKDTHLHFLPQWMEYNVMHGVDQFIFYTMKNSPKNRDRTLRAIKPYLENGLATVVDLDMPSDTAVKHIDVGDQYAVQDCIFRTKGSVHAEWVFPKLDTDEYLYLKSVHGKEDAPHSFVDMLNEADYNVSGVMFNREICNTPENESRELTISGALCSATPHNTKYAVRPHKCHAGGVHAPVSLVGGKPSLRLSWKPGSTSPSPTPSIDRAVVYHYRVSAAEIAARESLYKAGLVREEPSLGLAIRKRYGQPAYEVLQSIYQEGQTNPLKPSHVQIYDRDDEDDDLPFRGLQDELSKITPEGQ